MTTKYKYIVKDKENNQHEFSTACDAAIYACNNEYGPGMTILTNDIDASQTWIHFEYRKDL